MAKVSDDDLALVEALMVEGPSAFTNRGLSSDDAADFLQRPEVRATLERINSELGQQEALMALVRFTGRRKLSKLVPKAVEVLDDALDGPLYAMHEVIDAASGERVVVPRLDTKGEPIMLRPGPTPVQLRAATEVLDRVGLAPTTKIQLDRAGSINLPQLLGRVVESQDPVLPEMEGSREQQGLSRERVRNAIEVLRGNVRQVLEVDKVAVDGLRRAAATDTLVVSSESKPIVRPKPKSKPKSAKGLKDGKSGRTKAKTKAKTAPKASSRRKRSNSTKRRRS